MALPDLFSKGNTKVRGKRVIQKVAAVNQALSIPANCLVTDIYFRNRTANAVTGGIKIGSTAGGTDIVAAQAVAASAASIARVSFHTGSAAKVMYIDAVTSWNGAVVDIYFEYVEIAARTDPNASLLDAEAVQ